MHKILKLFALIPKMTLSVNMSDEYLICIPVFMQLCIPHTNTAILLQLFSHPFAKVGIAKFVHFQTSVDTGVIQNVNDNKRAPYGKLILKDVNRGLFKSQNLHHSC